MVIVVVDSSSLLVSVAVNLVLVHIHQMMLNSYNASTMMTAPQIIVLIIIIVTIITITFYFFIFNFFYYYYYYYISWMKLELWRMRQQLHGESNTSKKKLKKVQFSNIQQL